MCDGVQVLCTVIMIIGLCDLVKTVDLTDDSNDVPNYQIISPISLLLSAVNVCVYMCVFVCMYVDAYMCMRPHVRVCVCKCEC